MTSFPAKQWGLHTELFLKSINRMVKCCVWILGKASITVLNPDIYFYYVLFRVDLCISSRSFLLLFIFRQKAEILCGFPSAVST